MAWQSNNSLKSVPKSHLKVFAIPVDVDRLSNRKPKPSTPPTRGHKLVLKKKIYSSKK